MDYVNLGNTGLKVSRLCLGCMTYGSSKWRPWVLDEEAAMPFFKAGDRGGDQLLRHRRRLFSQGESERVTGKALKEYAKRHEVVIATKVNGPMGADANNRGLSRKHIMDGIDQQPAAAGRRLCRPLPDPPLRLRHADRGDAGGAERRRARRQGPLHRRQLDVRVAVHEDAGRLARPTAGRRSSPCSRSTTWSTARRSARCCRSAGTEGVGVIPWSPLARGFLAGGRGQPRRRQHRARPHRRVLAPGSTTASPTTRWSTR